MVWIDDPIFLQKENAQFSSEEKLKEIAREIALREACYPKWVKGGRMRQDSADRGIAIMRDIAKDYGGHG